MLGQIPGGALSDAIRWKRALAAIGILMIGAAALILAFFPTRLFVFAAAGHALTAAVMGAAGAYLSESAIFLTAALLCIPALVALVAIRAEEIDYTRARNAATGDKAKLARLRDLAGNRALLLFAGCVTLFQLTDASMLPLVGETIAPASGSRQSADVEPHHRAANRRRHPCALGRLSL